MKAGAAAKMALSLFSTATMLQLGKVRDGHMIDMSPTNAKLRRRAVRMVVEMASVTAPRAAAALASTGWNVRAAIEHVSSARRRRRAR